MIKEFQVKTMSIAEKGTIPPKCKDKIKTSLLQTKIIIRSIKIIFKTLINYIRQRTNRMLILANLTKMQKPNLKIGISSLANINHKNKCKSQRIEK